MKQSKQLILAALTVAGVSLANGAASQVSVARVGDTKAGGAVPSPGARSLKMPETYSAFFPGAEAAKETTTKPRPRFGGTPVRVSDNASANLYGYLYYFAGDELQQGMYRIGNTPAATFMWSDLYTDGSMTMTSGWMRDGRLWGVNSLKFMGGIYAYGQVELDLVSGEVLDFKQLRFTAENLENQYVTMAYRELDDRVYGYGYNTDGTGYGFNSAEATDIDTSSMIVAVSSEEVCTSLCYNIQDDMFYGINMKGEFVSVNKDGEQTAIFTLPLDGVRNTVTGIVYSPKDGKYIWNAYMQDGSSAMYAIDAGAKSATKLYDCANGEEYIYMVTTDDNVDSEAPAKPTIDNINFQGDALNGVLTFTMPGSTAAGNPINGQLDWRLHVDGEITKSGSSAAGSKVNITIDALANGMHTFAVSVGKEGKYSLPATDNYWVGTDYPEAPTDLTLTLDKLTWEPVTESVHGGYMDLAALTYEVCLNGDKVATTSGTETVITMPEGRPYTSYTATVRAVAGGKTSEAGESNYVNYGDPLEIDPKIYYRPEEEEFSLFTAIDLDGKTTADGQVRNWQFSDYMGFPSFMSGADGEDLLIFPPMNFTRTDKAYKFSMEAGLRLHTPTTNTIEVWIGKEPTMEGMTQRIMAPYAPQNMLADVLTEYFAVNEPGTYYIGILTKTDAVGIHISELTVEATDRDAEVPQSVGDLGVTAGANGALTATVNFTLPAKTANGLDIPTGTEITATVVSREFVVNHPEQGAVTATKSITGAPGSTQTVEIETLQGYNTIGVSCSVDGRAGSETTASVYTGVVKPYTVQNLKITPSEDNMEAILTWTPPVTYGDEAGPIGDSFFYSIFYYGEGWTYLDGAGWDVLEATVSLNEGDPQNYYILGVMALNAAGQSDYIASGNVVIGTPYTLPMVENFPDYDATYWPIMSLTPSEEYQGTYWMVDDPAELSPLFANESGVATIGYIGDSSVSHARGRMSLPKFSTEDQKSVKLSLTYWGGPYGAKMSLLTNKFGLEAPETVGEFPTGNGWVTNTLELPSTMLGEKWVELLIDAELTGYGESFAMFSAYRIEGISGVEGVAADNHGRVFTTSGMLHVAGYAGEALTVCDMSGLTVVSEASLGDMNGYALAPGVYVARVGGESFKVSVK